MWAQTLRTLPQLRILLSLVLLLAACDSIRQEAPASQTASQLAAKAQPRVDVFVTDWCPYCQRLEAFLQSHNVAYVRHNIEESEQAMLEHRELGGGGIPVTRIGTKVVRGFQPEVIGRMLGIRPDES